MKPHSDCVTRQFIKDILIMIGLILFHFFSIFMSYHLGYSEGDFDKQFNNNSEEISTSSESPDCITDVKLTQKSKCYIEIQEYKKENNNAPSNKR